MSFIVAVARQRAKEKNARRLLAAPQFFESSNRPHSLTNRASSLVSDLAQDDLDLEKKGRVCNYYKMKMKNGKVRVTTTTTTATL